MLEAPALLWQPARHIGSQSYLPRGRGSISCPYPDRNSIYPPINDERLSGPEPTQVNNLPGVATVFSLHTWITLMLYQHSGQLSPYPQWEGK